MDTWECMGCKATGPAMERGVLPERCPVCSTLESTGRLTWKMPEPEECAGCVASAEREERAIPHFTRLAEATGRLREALQEHWPGRKLPIDAAALMDFLAEEISAKVDPSELLTEFVEGLRPPSSFAPARESSGVSDAEASLVDILVRITGYAVSLDRAGNAVTYRYNRNSDTLSTRVGDRSLIEALRGACVSARRDLGIA